MLYLYRPKERKRLEINLLIPPTSVIQVKYSRVLTIHNETHFMQEFDVVGGMSAGV